MLEDKRSNGILKMPYCVGLTGTIASGKTTAASYFKRIGIDVIDADAIARTLVAPHQPALLEIKNHFGEQILTHEGVLDRRKLRAHIIQHPKDKAWLEACLHPKIRREIEKQISISKAPYAVIEIPLLMHREDYPYLNRVLLIKSTHTQQISRITRRDHCTENEALAFLKLQKNHAEAHAAIADDVVENDSSLTLFIEKLEALHHVYLSAAKNALISSSDKAGK